MISLATWHLTLQLDSYKVDKKLCDEKGNILDMLRALYMICEAKGILHSYHQVRLRFPAAMCPRCLEQGSLVTKSFSVP